MKFLSRSIAVFGAVLLASFIIVGGASGCAKKTPSTSACAPMTGSAWVPNTQGLSASNHDSSVTLNRAVYNGAGPVIGYAQNGTDASYEVPIEIDMSQDLGPMGSLTLVASVTGLPGKFQGDAYAMLVSLKDVNGNEYVNLSQTAPRGCYQNGYYDASGSAMNPGCTIGSTSAFVDDFHWQEHQIVSQSGAGGTPSVNTFPTCNWTSGQPECAFNSKFFTDGKLPSAPAGKYLARYAIISDSYATDPKARANVQVTAIKKFNPKTAPGGALDVNVILVGQKNIQDSHTNKGQRNLNSLISNISGYYNDHAAANVKLGSVNVYEWSCQQGGDAYAMINTEQMGEMISASGKLLDARSDGKALNVYLISSFTDNVGPGLIVEGLSAAISGPPMNGTNASGVAFATQDELADFNASCAEGEEVCRAEKQSGGFWQISVAMAHEMGHFLGLSHPSESTGTIHDILPDIPICTNTARGLGRITNMSCAQDTHPYIGSGKTCADACPGYPNQLCPQALECQFNYMMWWTSKNFSGGTGDGTVFSPAGGAVMNYHALIQ